MQAPAPSYRIFPLGDSAISLDFGNRIDEDWNEQVMARYRDWKQSPLPGMTELVPAYSSLTVYYDLLSVPVPAGATITAYEVLRQEIEKRMNIPVSNHNAAYRILSVPVCYDPEFAPDMGKWNEVHGLSPEQVIREHTAGTYKVFMLGFLPGFAYMGSVNEIIAMPRKPVPEPARAGSVGIAGLQTGIYPLDSPGGWSIIGRTPWTIFDPFRDEPSLFREGDRVRFYSISRTEFDHMIKEVTPIP